MEVESKEPILLVQIALVIMFLSWPIALIVMGVNYLSDINLDGLWAHIIGWPLVIVGMLTMNGVPTK